VSKIFGELIRELRKENNISQETLADNTQLDRTYISMLERGIRQPTLATILSLSKALKISASELIKRVEDKMEGANEV
jgi:transcriptional regulator with XRE-family HTH domain